MDLLCVASHRLRSVLKVAFGLNLPLTLAFSPLGFYLIGCGRCKLPTERDVCGREEERASYVCAGKGCGVLLCGAGLPLIQAKA